MNTKYSGSISIDTGSLYLCDMRYGPTEDGYVFNVDKGEYLILHQEDSNTGLNTALIIRDGVSPDREEVLSNLSSELNMFGVLDKAALIDEFGSVDELFEWGDLEVYLYAENMFIDIQSPRGNQIHCFTVGKNESEHAVISLYQGDALVGFRVELNDDEYSEQLTKSSATISKVELIYQQTSIVLYVFSEYDQASIDDTVRESILDFIEDDATTIYNILNNKETKIEVDTPLQDVNSSFSKLSGFKLYRKIGDEKPILIHEIQKPNEMPENTIQGIRNAILKWSRLQKQR